jgi:hypothetical protein
MDNPIVAYELGKNLNHLSSLPKYVERVYGEVEDYDALIYEPCKTREISSGGLVNVTPYNGPEPVIWIGFLDRLPYQTDFLNNDLLWPIVSKRMLYVLLSVGNFPYKAIPVKIFDYSLRNELNEYLNREELSSEICNQSYVALQLLERIDAIDFDNSEFEEPIPDSIVPPKITWLVLKEPQRGFPPIFRLDKKNTTCLYVSPAAKEALEEAEIRGLEFIPEEGIRPQEVSAAL